MPALVLHPRDPAAAPAAATLVARLRGLGLIGEPWPAGPGPAFLPGPEYLRHLSLLGCAPRIQLRPAPGRTPATVGIVAGGPARWWCAPRARPRCPACRQPLDFRPPLAARPVAGLPACTAQPAVTCGHCGRRQPAGALDWRRRSAVAAVLVAFHGIHPHEAVPSDALLADLERLTACPWDFAYL